jgi:predicted ester cyclase
MADLLDRVLRLWAAPPDDDATAVAAFRELYTDPVPVNGVAMTAAGLLARARALHAALESLEYEIVERFEVAGRIAVVHRQSGRHVGPLPTPLGELAPTGRRVQALTIDVLTVADGRITAVWVTSDDLARLARLGALRLVQPPG